MQRKLLDTKVAGLPDPARRAIRAAVHALKIGQPPVAGDVALAATYGTSLPELQAMADQSLARKGEAKAKVVAEEQTRQAEIARRKQEQAEAELTERRRLGVIADAAAARREAERRKLAAAERARDAALEARRPVNQGK